MAFEDSIKEFIIASNLIGFSNYYKSHLLCKYKKKLINTIKKQLKLEKI